MDEQSRQEYLTEKQVAAITGMSVSTLQNHRFYRTGLPYVKFSRSVRYSIDDVRAYMVEHTIQPSE